MSSKHVVFYACLTAVSLNVLGQKARLDSLTRALAGAKEKEKIDVLLELSGASIRVDFGNAVNYANDALSVARKVRDNSAIARALTQRAHLFWLDGRYDSSIILNKQSRLLCLVDGDAECVAANSLGIARNYYYSADYDSAIRYHRQSLALYRQAANIRKEAEVLNQIGLVYHLKGDYPNSVRFLHEYARVRQQLTGFMGRTYVLGPTSPFFKSSDYFRQELKVQFDALRILRSAGDEGSILLTYLNLADSYKELQEFDSALLYHKRAAAYASSIGVRPELTYLGNAYRSAGMPDSALLIHDKSYEDINGHGTRLELLELLINYGKDYASKGNAREAQLFYGRALALTTTMGNKLDIVINSNRLADTHIQLGQPKQALFHCRRAVRYAKRIKSRTYIRDSYLLMSQVQSAVGNHDSAYYYLSAGHALSDSITREEADLQYAEIQAQFQLEEKEEDIRALSHEKQMQEDAIRNREYLIASAVSVVVLSSLLAFSTFLRYRQKNRANKILQEQKKQIELLFSEVHHRVKNNLQIVSSLLKIQSRQLTDSNARLAVLEGQSRVQAMGLIHENIYQSDNFAFINMEGYLSSLASALLETFDAIDKVRVEIRAPHLVVDVETAIPIGLIVNELVTNSLKHAFTSTNKPLIRIELGVDASAKLALEISDNGSGMGAGIRAGSFGLRLVRELAIQLGGTLEFAGKSGVTALMKFTKFKIAV